MRQLWRALHSVPQLLLVQPEQLGYDLAYALALLPLVVAGIVFFLQDAVLLFGIALLAGIVCLLAIQLARLTFGLPPWVGFKATHPLVASILIACFLPPRTPAWVAAAAVIVFIVIDTLLWPQLRRVMLHPALLVFGVLFLIERQLGVGFINPADGRHLAEPLLLWFAGNAFDPVKAYVGNVPGPIGVTSAGAVLLGATYLWYTRKISLGVVAGFLCGIAAVAIVLRADVAFQLASGPSLFLAAYIAADRRRVLLPEMSTLLFGVAAGVATMMLRFYGQGLQAAWMGLAVASVVVTAVLRGQGLLRTRGGAQPAAGQLRALPVDSAERERPAARASARADVRQPVMAALPVGAGYSRSTTSRPIPRFDTHGDPNDLVREMRRAAKRGGLWWGLEPGTLLLLASLLIFNPAGLALTWRTRTFNRQTKLLLSAVSVLWYLGVAGLVFALLHR
ncbi:MAG TPA: RnfABCDGE type electron transport complex subunit D [Candidatus Acidoferrum sp.]|nr:RnfABCDGE type electron transport complex subunit D [Candidatus Acidoferrum sp.]